MVSKMWIWKNISGVASRCNDILYMQPKLQPTHNLLIFFGGDVQWIASIIIFILNYVQFFIHLAFFIQIKFFRAFNVYSINNFDLFNDFQEHMEKHPDSKEYVKWSLENTATLLSEQFPKNHILIVRPTRMSITKNAVFSCFDNFVPGDKYGTPTFCPMHNAVKHLRELLVCCLEHLKALKIEDIPNHNIKATNLMLMGFSKGCAVLNQFLYEFHYYQNTSNNVDINNFIKLIKDMWWLDGGHNGSKNTWITEKSILQSFAKLKINTHIHVTPYQVRDIHRPWIRFEENCFSESLQKMEVPVYRALHFSDKARSLSSHFNILTDIGSNVKSHDPNS